MNSLYLVGRGGSRKIDIRLRVKDEPAKARPIDLDQVREEPLRAALAALCGGGLEGFQVKLGTHLTGRRHNKDVVVRKPLEQLRLQRSTNCLHGLRIDFGHIHVLVYVLRLVK